jgi:tetratricopeptide (TPR) repeat protein
MTKKNGCRLFRYLFFAWIAVVSIAPQARAQEAANGKGLASPSISTTAAPPTPPAAASGPTLASAMLLYRAGDYEKASNEYNALIAANPNSSNAYAGLARVYMKQTKLADALSAGKKSVELDPANPIGHVALGEVYFRMGKIGEAEAEFVPIVKAGKGYARAYLGEARVSWASSYYTQAKRLIDFAYELDSADPDILDFWLDTEDLGDRIKRVKQQLADPTKTDPKRR